MKIKTPHYGALPRRFRKPRVLILGCGDVGLRVLRLFGDRMRVVGVVRRAEAAQAVREAGGVPLLADLMTRSQGERQSARRLAGLAGPATRIIHSAPPAGQGLDDPLTRQAVAALARARHWTYLSTTGVYGDCGGALFDETRPPAPANARSRRRLAAEARLRAHAARSKRSVCILRVPGIYAQDRLPIARLTAASPALTVEDDVYTNHIHAQDLARIAFVCTWRGRGGRLYHACDNTPMRMGEYFDAVADAHGLARPPRLPREALRTQVSPMLYSFMSESRRLLNRRLLRELRIRLRYPSVQDFLANPAR